MGCMIGSTLHPKVNIKATQYNIRVSQCEHKQVQAREFEIFFLQNLQWVKKESAYKMKINKLKILEVCLDYLENEVQLIFTNNLV